jgi:L-lactate utilization protein LutB
MDALSTRPTKGTSMIDITMKSLEKNNIKAYFVPDRDKARDLVMSMIGKSDVVGSGGSVTLDECKIRDALRKGYKFLDWFPAKDDQEKNELRRRSLTCDVFVCGTNAITMDGKLVNVDGYGNRVAAIIYGPKKVIIVVGKNKITKNIDEAIIRINTVAAPKNCERLNRKTPCVKTGKCMGCSSPDRLCSSLVILEWQRSQRIHVIIVDEELGF